MENSINLKQHIKYSKNPELFMKERWFGFDAFETESYKHITPFEYQLKCINNFHNIRHNIIVKTRQMHITSMMELYIAWYVLFNNDKRVFILSSSSELARKILKKIKIILQNYYVEDIFNWEGDFVINNLTRLTLKNGCSIRVSGPSIDAGRGEGIDFLYVDEAAFIKNFEDIYMGVGMAVSCIKDSKMVIASTPKDHSIFNKMYLNASNSFLNTFNPIKLHWSIHPIYSKEITKDLEQEYDFVSPWFIDFCNKLGNSKSIIDSELECIIKYKDQTNKSKTISLRLDEDTYKKIQYKIGDSENVSDYIRKLIEKDLK